MTTTNEQNKVIKIATTGAFLQSFIQGLSKNPSEGESIMTSFDKSKAMVFKDNSDELQFTEAKLQANSVDYTLVPAQ